MKIYRIIKLKKGKNVYGGNIVNSEGELFKIVFSKQEIDKYNLGIGSTFLCNLIKSKNKFTGEPIYIPFDIDKINNLSSKINQPYNQIRFSDKKI